MFVTVLLLACALTGAVVFWVCRMQQRDLAREAQLANQLQNAQATELVANDIAATIHDGPSQVLAVSIIRLQTLLEDWPDGKPAPAPLRDTLIRIVEVLKDAAGVLHQVARDNKLPEMTDLPLHRVLARAVSDFTARTGIVVGTHWGAEASTIVVSDTLNGVVYRCVQEALINSFKHADGDGLAVHLRAFDRRVVIQISDEGPGFNPDGNAGNERLGLRLLQERVKGIGGQLRYLANAPRGVCVEISFDILN